MLGCAARLVLISLRRRVREGRLPKLDMTLWRHGAAEINPVFGNSTGPFAELVLGDQAALTQFGVRIERLPPGSQSSERHWHEAEDELVYVLSGELVLLEDEEQLLRAGEAAAWPAGKPVAHCLVNRSEADATFLVVGTRSPADIVTYPKHGLRLIRNGSERQYEPTSPSETS
jgi:uncharacterized cupin superfamily protein